MASEYERIEAEMKIRQEVDYERGYRFHEGGFWV